MATRRLFLAARVAEPALDGWLRRCRRPRRRRPDRGRRRRATRCRPTPATTHEVHDLGDVSLLPGFVETHVHMHFPVAARLPRDRPARSRSSGCSSGRRRTCAGSCCPGRRRPATPAAATTSRWRSGRRSATGSSPSVRGCSSPARRSPRPPATTGSSAPRPTRPTRSSGASASARRLGVDASRSWRRAAATRRPRTRARSSTGSRRCVPPSTEAHRLGLPVLAHSLTAASNRICAEAGVDTIIHGGVWWTEYPDPRPRVRLRPGGRGPDRRARDLGRPDDRRGRAASRASRRRAARQARVRALGAARRAQRARAAPRVHARHGRSAASGSSAGWGWACRS